MQKAKAGMTRQQRKTDTLNRQNKREVKIDSENERKDMKIEMENMRMEGGKKDHLTHMWVYA